MTTSLSQTQEETKNASPKDSESAALNGEGKTRANYSGRLSELLRGVAAVVPAGAADLEIRQVACDSRKAQPQSLFFALRGAKLDGNEYAREAVSRGAVAIVSETAPPSAMPSAHAARKRRQIGRTSTTSGTKWRNRFWMPCLSVAVDDGQPAQAPFICRKTVPFW